MPHDALGKLEDALTAASMASASSRIHEAVLGRLLEGVLLLDAEREKEARRALGDLLPRDTLPDAAIASVAKRLAKHRETPLSNPDDRDMALYAVYAIAASSLLRGPDSADVADRAEALSVWLGTRPSGFIAPRSLAHRAVLARIETRLGRIPVLGRAADVVIGRIDRDAFAAYLAERRGDVAS